MDKIEEHQQKLYLLMLTYSKIIAAIDSADSEYGVYATDELETVYKWLVDIAQGILDGEGFKSFEDDENYIIESLIHDGATIDAHWESFKTNLLKSLDRLEREWQLNGGKDYELHDDFEALFDAADQTIKLNAEIVEAKATGDKDIATLEFVGLSTQPKVTINDKPYYLSAMRQDGDAYQVISYCLKELPYKEVDRKFINSKLNLSIENFNTSFQRSPLDKDKPLRPFVDVQPHSVIVKNLAILTHIQTESLIKASKNQTKVQ